MAERGTFDSFFDWFEGVQRSVKAASKVVAPRIIPKSRERIADAIEYGVGKNEPKPILRTAQSMSGDTWENTLTSEMLGKVLSGEGETDFSEEISRARRLIRKDIVRAGRAIGAEKEARIMVGLDELGREKDDRRAEIQREQRDLRREGVRDDGEMRRTSQRQSRTPKVPTGTKGRRLGVPKPLDIKHNPSKPIGSKRRGDGVPSVITPRGNRK